MPTAKELDRISTVIGSVMVILSLVMAAYAFFTKMVDVNWYIPAVICTCGLGLIGANATIFNAIGNFFTRKANNL